MLLQAVNITGEFILIASGSLLTIIIFFFLLLVQSVKKRVEHTKQIEQLKAAHEQILLKSQLEIQETTLRNIGYEIHDNIGQILSLVSLNLNTINTTDYQKLQTTEELVTRAVSDLRALSKTLNTDRVVQMGLINTLEKDVDYLKQSGRFNITFTVAKNFPTINENTTVIVYRLIQEVLNNIIKHSKATNILLAFDNVNNGEPSINIKDNGVGFNANTNTFKGMGLQTITYRAKVINATLQINSEINKGTSILLLLPKNT